MCNAGECAHVLEAASEGALQESVVVADARAAVARASEGVTLAMASRVRTWLLALSARQFGWSKLRLLLA